MLVLSTNSLVRSFVAILMIVASLAPRISFPHVARVRSRLSRDHARAAPSESGATLAAFKRTETQTLPAIDPGLKTETITLAQAYAEAVPSVASPRARARALEDPLLAIPRLLRLRF